MTAAIGGDLAALTILLALLCVAATAVAALWRWPLIVAALVVGICNSHLQADLGIETGYFRLSPLDLTASIAVGAAMLRLLGSNRIPRLQLLWIAVTAVLALAFAYGAARHGVTLAGIFYRYFFYLTAGAMYAMAFPWTAPDLDRFARLWMAAGAVLAALCLSLWLAPGWTDLDAGDTGPFAYLSSRVLPAASAFLLSQVALIGIAAWSRGVAPPFLLPLTVTCLLLSLLLFHRSVWLSTMVGFAVLIAVNARLFLPIMGALTVVGVVGAVAAGLAGGFGAELSAEPLTSAVDEALSESSSLDWRVTGWEILIDRTLAEGPLSVLFGGGFGIGYERMIGWARVEYSPHNVYVEIFINAGLLGVGLWVLFHGLTILRLWRDDAVESALLDRSAAIALMASLVAYGLPYSPSTEQGLLLGVLGAMAAQAGRVRNPDEASPQESVR